MSIKSRMLIIFLLGVFVTSCFADTFKNKESGETFTGFMTQKHAGGKTLVYNSDEKKLASVVLNDYEVAYDSQGRKDTVVVVPITQSEVLLSKVVAEKIAATIINASNKGPQFIIVQIDNPGGRGDYMKIIATAITQTKNCPVVAYIDDKQYGGAFSTAAVIAMACDKVFVAPTASVGAIGPIVGTTVANEEFNNYIAAYCSDSLASYSIYTTALAHENNRPALLVRALIDKRVSVVEVKDIHDNREYIQEDDRQGTQTIVRKLAEGLAKTDSSQTITQAEFINAVLNLPPGLAVDVGLADKVVNSITDIPSEMNLSEVQLTKASGIDKVIKKYSAARRNIAEGLARIDWLEERTSDLEGQFKEIEKQLRTGTITRQVKRGRTRLPDDYEGYYYDPSTGTISDSVTLRGNRNSLRNRRNRTHETETFIIEEPATDLETVQEELLLVLGDLIGEYRRVTASAKRWPGSLPPEIPLQMLVKNRDSAEAFRDYLLDLPDYYFDRQSSVDDSRNQRRRY